MKEQIERCIEYLKSISLKEPTDIRVEEIEEQRIVLSYTEKHNYTWENDRLYKEFQWENSQGNITSMKTFIPPNSRL
jgi:hypothetical protein